jgi:nucleotide-binding universal stress UspA family protein
MGVETNRFPITLVLATDGSPAEVLLEAAREGERPTLMAVGSRGLWAG